MLRALLVVAFAIGNLIAPLATRIAGFGIPIDQAVNPGVPPPEQPTGFTFSIWGLIFALSLLFAARQASERRRDSAVYQKMGWPAAIALGLTCAWMVIAQFRGNGPELVVCIWLIWVFAYQALVRTLAMRPILDGFDRVITLPLFAMLTSWISAAAVLNTAAYVRLVKLVPAGMSPVLFAGVALCVVAALSLLVLGRARGYLPVALTTLWALGGVAYANTYEHPERGLVALTAVLALLIIARVGWYWRPVKGERY